MCIRDRYVGDDTYLITDSAVLGFGADKDTLLTHTDGTGLTLNSTNKLCFNDASQFIQGSSATVLSIGATDEIDLTATAVDLNGTLNVSGVATFQATPVFPDGSLALADLDIDGGTDIGADIVDADLFIVDDGAGGTNRKTAASRLKTYIGSGLSGAQMFRLTAEFTGAANPIASNWEALDTDGYGAIGSYVSESSGVFSFSTTGFYRVEYVWYGLGNNDNRVAYTPLYYTADDGSNWSNAAEGRSHAHQISSSAAGMTTYCTHQVDVTDTSNQKFQFSVSHQGNASDQTTLAGTNETKTCVIFTRLGDT